AVDHALSPRRGRQELPRAVHQSIGVGAVRAHHGGTEESAHAHRRRDREFHVPRHDPISHREQSHPSGSERGRGKNRGADHQLEPVAGRPHRRRRAKRVMFKNQPITRKLLTVILLTSGAVLTLTCGTLFAYELVTFRQSMVQSLSTLAQAIATNSTASLAFQNPEDATQMLSAFAADPHVVAAALYDRDRALFASYERPSGPRPFVPRQPARDGYVFSLNRLVLFHPVVIENRRLGTLYLESDLDAMYQTFALYGGTVIGVIVAAGAVAFFLAMRLQRHITQPVLALAQTAKTVAAEQDYSARAERFDEDELGELTDAFNAMLAQIQQRDEALR